MILLLLIFPQDGDVKVDADKVEIWEKQFKYVCAECGARYTHRRELYEHEQIHTGHKSHTCTYEGCDFATRL